MAVYALALALELVLVLSVWALARYAGPYPASESRPGVEWEQGGRRNATAGLKGGPAPWGGRRRWWLPSLPVLLVTIVGQYTGMAAFALVGRIWARSSSWAWAVQWVAVVVVVGPIGLTLVGYVERRFGTRISE